MGNTLQNGVKKDDDGGSRNQQPQAVSVVPDQFQACVKGDDHEGSRNQQLQVVSVVLDQDQFPAGAAERAPNQLHPLGGDGGGHAGAAERAPNQLHPLGGDGGERAPNQLHPLGGDGGGHADAAERAPNQLHPLGGDGGGHDFQATSMLKNCKKTSATDGGGGRSRTESPPSLPELEGARFVLNTLPVNPRCVGDGDGFTAYVKKAAVVAVNGYEMPSDTNNRDPQQYRIRMRGIDAPELKMQYGVESKNELVKLIGGKRVTIVVYGNDQYERYLGDVYCDGVFIEEQMLKRGFAWHYKIYDNRPELAQWEREAKAACLGLWSLDYPQKPWEWRRDNPRNNKKDNVDDSQVELQSQGNGSSETLPWLIRKDMETLGREWQKKLENFVADNMKLNDQLHELKRSKKEAEDQAKKSEKEMQSVVADNMKLNDQLQESKKNKKEAEDRILELIFLSESVAAVNMDLHDKLEELKKKNKKAEDRAKESEKKMESVVADNRKLNDQLQELKGNKKVAEDRAMELNLFSESVAAINMDLHDKLEKLKKKNRKAEKEMEIVVAHNMKLNDQIQKLNKINKNTANIARSSKKKLQSVLAVNIDLNDKLHELQKKSEMVEDQAKVSEKEMENVVVENMERKLQGRHKKSGQAVQTRSAPPAKDSGEKETIVWRKKTAATTP